MPGFVFLSRQVELLGVKIIEPVFLHNVVPVNWQRKKYTADTISFSDLFHFFWPGINWPEIWRPPTLRAVVSPGRTQRFYGKETTASNLLLFHRACASKWWLRLESLRNDDGDGNENGKKAAGLHKQNNNFARASRFFVHLSAVVDDYNEKLPNFAFCRGREQKTTSFFFFSWTLMQSFRIQLQKNFPTFDEFKEME